MRLNYKQKYESLGFVEALIAIMISGIVATVLMNISVVAMRELVRLDIEDAQGHHARSAAVIVQNIANRERLIEGSILFSSLENNRCYTLAKEGDNYDIDPTIFYTFADRESYKEAAVITDGVNDNEEDYFRIICIESNRPRETNKLLIRVVIGFNKVQGLFSTTSDIRDFQYFAIINL